MKLYVAEKEMYLDQLWRITEDCYAGVELPTRISFERCVRNGDVFTSRGCGLEGVVGYALVESTNMTPLLRSIAVLPGSRGKGIGKELLREVSNHYRVHGFQHILLHCKVDNYPAQTLYLKEGYRVSAYLREYYKPEGDGLEMRITL